MESASELCKLKVEDFGIYGAIEALMLNQVSDAGFKKTAPLNSLALLKLESTFVVRLASKSLLVP